MKGEEGREGGRQEDRMEGEREKGASRDGNYEK